MSGTHPGPNPWGSRSAIRVGLLGGSFNPAHAGHLHISRLALKLLRLDQVWWLVSPQNPLKDPRDMASLPVRCASAQDIVGRDPRIRISDMEHRLDTRFTADSLRKIGQRHPRTRFVFLMGADNLGQLPRWHRWRRLMGTVPIAVFDRAPYSKRVLAGVVAWRFRRQRMSGHRIGCLIHQQPPAWVFLPIQRHAASASALRAQGWTVPKEQHGRPD